MNLTKKQEEGLQVAVERFLQGEKLTVIGGYAGAGKSTLIKYIIEALADYGIDPEEDVVYTSFTGKATQVLQKKGNKNVSTLHKLLFNSVPMANGKFLRKPVEDIPYEIVVIDEVSMVPIELIKRTLGYDVYVIACGDPAQLPPVDKESDNHLLDNPHVFLDEIMRQAQESEIIRLTMAIREGKSLNDYNGKDVIILPYEKLNTGMLQWANQILCATNNTRQNLNNQMRELLGRYGSPQDGDKVICTRNYWETWADNDDALVNGTIGYLDNVYNSFLKLPKFVGGRQVPIIGADFCTDGNATFKNIDMDKQMILTGKQSIDWKTSYKINRSKWKGTLPLEFLYGYAITGWKAQGSEWDNVLAIEEPFPYDRETHKRFLYTIATRASEKLVLVRK